MNTGANRTKLAAVSAFKIHHPPISPFSNNQGAPSSLHALNGIQVLSPSSGHKNMPTVLDALVLREEIRKGGLYGIGKSFHYSIYEPSLSIIGTVTNFHLQSRSQSSPQDIFSAANQQTDRQIWT